MGKLLVINVKDVNGLNSNTSFWVHNQGAAEAALQDVKNLSNAQILSAYLVETLNLSALEGNDAAVANNETVKVKAKVRLSGATVGSEGAARLTATVSIPAPVGSLIDGIHGDTTGLLVAPFIGTITTHSGLEVDTIDKVYYSRSH